MKFKILKKEKRQPAEAPSAEKKKQRRRGKNRKMTPFYIVLSVFIIAAAIYMCLTMRTG